MSMASGTDPEGVFGLILGCALLSYPGIAWFIHHIGHTWGEALALAVPVAVIAAAFFAPALLIIVLETFFVVAWGAIAFYEFVVTIL